MIRNLDDGLKERLWVRAAQRGRSMEEEVRALLRSVLGAPVSHDNLADLATSLFGAEGVDLEPHPDVPAREAPPLDG